MAETHSKPLSLRNQISLHPLIQKALKRPVIQKIVMYSLAFASQMNTRRSGRSEYQKHFVSASIAGMLCMAIFAQGDFSPRMFQANLGEVTKTEGKAEGAISRLEIPQLELQAINNQLIIGSSRPLSADTRAFIFNIRVDPTRVFTGSQLSSSWGTIELSFKEPNQRTILLKKLPEASGDISSLLVISKIQDAQGIVRDSPLMIDKQGTTLLHLKTPLSLIYQ